MMGVINEGNHQRENGNASKYEQDEPDGVTLDLQPRRQAIWHKSLGQRTFVQ